MPNWTSFVLFFGVVVATVVSKPLWSISANNNYLHATPEISVRQYLAEHSPYYVYNVHTDLGNIPSTIFANSKPEVSHVPYNFYYETPVYDLRFPLNPIYPVLMPTHPGLPLAPILPPTSTQEPFDESNDDDIEKLDSKIDPGNKKPENSEQDDSITVEAI